MSLQLTRSGLLDTVQDMGRYGYQHVGINPSGAMDRFSAQLANALLGTPLQAPVVEMHFPAASLLFEKPAVICLAGADFEPVINDKSIPLCQPVVVGRNSVLQLQQMRSGARVYLSVWNGLQMEQWLGSYSTNLKAGAGGWKGRALQTGDQIPFKKERALLLQEKEVKPLPWKAARPESLLPDAIGFIEGAEWHWLTEEAKKNIQLQPFRISSLADRMGFRLSGKELPVKNNRSMLSSGVSFGTMQLLPSGQLIVLMADHQTTGGYPRVGHVISAALPVLAQKKPGEEIRFRKVSLAEAEQNLRRQQLYLNQIQSSCRQKMETLFLEKRW